MPLHPASVLLRSALRPPAGPRPAQTGGPAAGEVPATEEGLAYRPDVRPPALADPEQVESEIRPADLKAPPPEPTEAEDDVLRLLERRYKAAKNHQSLHVPEWMESRAMFVNRPWVLWDQNRAGFRDLRDPDSLKNGRRYTSRNLIRGKVLENVARLTANTPDVGIRPRNSLPLSVAAAHEARAVRKHFDQEFERPRQLQKMVMESNIFGPPCLKVYFDPSAEDDVPRLAEDGTVQGVFRARVGKVREEIVLATQWLGPSGGDFDGLPWLIHAKPMTLSDIQARFPDEGYRVDAERSVSGDMTVDSLTAAASGDYAAGDGDEAPHWAVVKELWERPTARYKKGRWLVWANGVLLTPADSPWPAARTDVFPLVPLYHIEMEDSLYGLNMVGDLVDVQRSINVAMSKLDEHRALPEYNVLTAKGQTLSRGAYRGQNVQHIEYGMEQGGQPPVVQPKPPLSESVMASIDLERQMMDSISLINRVSEGGLPSAGMPAAAIQMLQESDQSATKAQVANLNWFMQRVAELEIAAVAQYYTTPRMILMQDDPDPSAPAIPQPPQAAPTPPQGVPQAQDAQTSPGAPSPPPGAPVPAQSPPPQAPPGPPPGQRPVSGPMAFHALTGGGSVQVEIDAESATPRTPAVQLQFVQQLAASGGFTPEQLPVTVALLRAIDIYGTDDLADELAKVLVKMQEDAAGAAGGPMAQQQAQQQHEAQILALQHQQEEQAAQSQAQQAQAMEAIKAHAQIEVAQAKAQFAAMTASVPKVALSGMLDSRANVAAEGRAGLPGDLAEQQQAKALPVAAEQNRAGEAQQQHGLAQQGHALAAQGQQMSHESAQTQAEIARQKVEQAAPPPPGKRPKTL